MTPNFRFAALSWAGWILLLATVGVMVFVGYEFGEWAYRTGPDDYVRRRLRQRILRLVGVAALVGIAVVIFWIGKTFLRFCGISVFRDQKNSGADQKS
jgi:hypothetical protein